MKLDNINNIIGSELSQISKTSDKVNLVFKNYRDGNNIILVFNGLVFETTISALNKKVKRTELKNILGFKAVVQLGYQGIESSGYKQLLIEMEGSSNENKIELICVLKNYKMKSLPLEKVPH